MASGWWDNDGAISGCVAAYQPIGAASLAASYSNLQNPGTYDASPGTAPTFAAPTGWTFNGTTQSLNTGLTPGSNWSVICRLTVTSNQNGFAVGHFLTWGVGHWAGGGGPIYAAGNFRFGGTATPTYSAVLAHTGTQGYRDAVTDGLGLTGGAAGGAITIGGAGGFYLGGTIAALAVYNVNLTAGNITTLTTLINALPVASGQPAAVRGVLVPGMNRDGRRVLRPGWG